MLQRMPAAITWTDHHDRRADQRDHLRGRSVVRHAGRPARGSGVAEQSSTSISTTTREKKAIRGATGSESRQRAPRPSRHQVFTPKSSAPPEATRPGQDGQHLPLQVTGERDRARHQRPARSCRGAAAPSARPPPGRCAASSRSPSAASVRAGKWPDSSRSSSRIGRCSAQRAGMAPSDDGGQRRSPTMTSRPSAHGPQRPAWASRTSDAGAARWGCGPGRVPACRSRRGRRRRRRARHRTRKIAMPCRPRRTPSASQPSDLRQRRRRHDPEQHRDLVGPQRARARGRTTSAPSSIQACMIQAMFSGASSSAPRWSVVVETGKATAWSRGTTSRPPAEATAVKLARSRKPERGRGQQREDLAAVRAREVAAEVRRRDGRRHRQGERRRRPDDPQPTPPAGGQCRSAGTPAVTRGPAGWSGAQSRRAR